MGWSPHGPAKWSIYGTINHNGSFSLFTGKRDWSVCMCLCPCVMVIGRSDRGGVLLGMGGGLCVIWGSTLPWDLSQIYPCTPHPCFSGGYERRSKWETFLGIISPGEWRLQRDQIWWEGGRGSGAALRLPVTHCQVFTSLASWKPSIPASCLGVGTGVVGVRGGGGSIMKTLSDHSPPRWHLNTKTFWCSSGAETLTFKCYEPTHIQT